MDKEGWIIRVDTKHTITIEISDGLNKYPWIKTNLSGILSLFISYKHYKYNLGFPVYHDEHYKWIQFTRLAPSIPCKLCSSSHAYSNPTCSYI